MNIIEDNNNNNLDEKKENLSYIQRSKICFTTIPFFDNNPDTIALYKEIEHQLEENYVILEQEYRQMAETDGFLDLVQQSQLYLTLYQQSYPIRSETYRGHPEMMRVAKQDEAYPVFDNCSNNKQNNRMVVQMNNRYANDVDHFNEIHSLFNLNHQTLQWQSFEDNYQNIDNEDKLDYYLMSVDGVGFDNSKYNNIDDIPPIMYAYEIIEQSNDIEARLLMHMTTMLDLAINVKHYMANFQMLMYSTIGIYSLNYWVNNDEARFYYKNGMNSFKVPRMQRRAPLISNTVAPIIIEEFDEMWTIPIKFVADRFNVVVLLHSRFLRDYKLCGLENRRLLYNIILHAMRNGLFTLRGDGIYIRYSKDQILIIRCNLYVTRLSEATLIIMQLFQAQQACIDHSNDLAHPINQIPIFVITYCGMQLHANFEGANYQHIQRTETAIKIDDIFDHVYQKMKRIVFEERNDIYNDDVKSGGDNTNMYMTTIFSVWSISEISQVLMNGMLKPLCQCIALKLVGNGHIEPIVAADGGQYKALPFFDQAKPSSSYSTRLIHCNYNLLSNHGKIPIHAKMSSRWYFGTMKLYFDMIFKQKCHHVRNSMSDFHALQRQIMMQSAITYNDRVGPLDSLTNQHYYLRILSNAYQFGKEYNKYLTEILPSDLKITKRVWNRICEQKHVCLFIKH